MEEEMKEKEKKKPSFLLALLPLLFMFVVLYVGLVIFDVDIKVLLLICAAFTVLICLYLGYSWNDIQDEIVAKLAKAFPAIMILITVGLMIGAWMIGGTIPFLVYLGLKIISPRFIIITSFLVTVILSISTGTSWGSAGTVGAALMGVAAGMNAPLPIVAGAIVAGAYFGDKMSPLSDSTNMAAIATDTNLYAHVGHMLYTTVPGFIISSIVYLIAGAHFASSGSVAKVDEIIAEITELFNLSMPVGLLLLIPPIIVIVGSIMKKPTIPVMMISSAVAVLLGITTQGFSFVNAATAMVSGFSTDMFPKAVDTSNLLTEVTNLLERGGMLSMMNTALMAFCAFAFIGALTVSGTLDVVIKRIMRHIHSTGQLITITVIIGVVCITVIGEATVSFLMIGGLFKDEYIKRGLQTKNLSRSLEDSITVVEPLVPWSLAGVFMTSTLGVPTQQYAPWAVLCYTGVIFAIIWGFTGFGIAKIHKDGPNYKDYVRLTGKTLDD
ncbi:MAG: Na+/H+ antiporter NhaC [Bilifractor sp.]